MSRRRLVLVVASIAAALLTPATARAEQAAGIVGTTTLATFDTASPGVVTLRQITGLSPLETVVGVDVRPATGQLYAVAVPITIVANALVHTYTVDPATGAATLAGSIPNTVPGAADTQWGLDFNPAVDRIRAVVANNESFRINPSNGSLAGDDVNLTFSGGATGPIVAGAYDRNTVRPAGVTIPTTLYEIDRGANRLDVQGGIDGAGPGGVNGGVVTSVGQLGVTLDSGSDAGFDISGASGTAYATLRVGGVRGLYTVDLATGAATLVGSFPVDVRDVAVFLPPPLPPPPPPPPPGPTLPRDTTRPAVLVDLASSASFARLVGAKLAFAFSCSEACTASARLATGRTTLATGSASLRAAGISRLRLRATSAGKRYLSRRLHPTRRRVRTTLALTVSDVARNASRLSRRVTLAR